MRAGAMACLLAVTLGLVGCSESDAGLSDDNVADLRGLCEELLNNSERCGSIVDRIDELVAESECAWDQAVHIITRAAEDPDVDLRDLGNVPQACNL